MCWLLMAADVRVCGWALTVSGGVAVGFANALLQQVQYGQGQAAP